MVQAAVAVLVVALAIVAPGATLEVVTLVMLVVKAALILVAMVATAMLMVIPLGETTRTPETTETTAKGPKENQTISDAS